MSVDKSNPRDLDLIVSGKDGNIHIILSEQDNTEGGGKLSMTPKTAKTLIVKIAEKLKQIEGWRE